MTLAPPGLCLSYCWPRATSPNWVPVKGRWRLAAGEWRQVWFVCGWQVKLCDPLVTYLSALEMGSRQSAVQIHVTYTSPNRDKLWIDAISRSITLVVRRCSWRPNRTHHHCQSIFVLARAPSLVLYLAACAATRIWATTCSRHWLVDGVTCDSCCCCCCCWRWWWC